MGPICLFDKSFLQGLKLDEAVFFDHFFLPVVVPVFYAETLADLAKPPKDRHTSEDEVARIAKKFPEMNGSPCAFHLDLIAADLMGNRVVMTGQIPRSGGKRVVNVETKAVVWEPSPESAAFDRWTRGEFEETERSFARDWRAALTQLDGAAHRRSLGTQLAADRFRRAGSPYRPATAQTGGGSTVTSYIGSRSGAHGDSVSPPRRKLRLQDASGPAPGALKPLATALIELAMALIREEVKSK